VTGDPSLSRFTTDGRLVGQSVSASSPLRESWPNFGCSQHSCSFLCHEAPCLSRGLTCLVTGHSPCLCQAIYTYEGLSKSFRTVHLERELQLVQLSATTCSCIAILWVSLVSFAAITLFVASQRLFIVVYFVIDSVRKLLDTPSYVHIDSFFFFFFFTH
jgi:hypothetical protein